MNADEKLRQVQEWANGAWRNSVPPTDYHRGFHHAVDVLQSILSDQYVAESALKVEAELPRPPLGVVPRWLHDEQRLAALTAAVQCSARTAGVEPNWPVICEWIEEMADIATRLSEGHVPATATVSESVICGQCGWPKDRDAPFVCPERCTCHG